MSRLSNWGASEARVRILWALWLLFLAPGGLAKAQPNPETCTYRSYVWDALNKRAVQSQRVRKPYERVELEERDPDTGCTLCEEDQVEIQVPPLAPFRVCRHLAPEVEAVVSDWMAAGIPVYSIEGYRVGKTRGNLDERGLRTRYSNHAYGIAIDINPNENGLYDRCVSFGPHCRLIRGGPWRPKQQLGSLLPDGPIVRAMKSLGFNWGGEIHGSQKDFMHFSPSGY